MVHLRILASGSSQQAQSQAKGKLFEDLMTKVLRNLGYSVDKNHPNINYAGMEIDIEGRSIIAGIPLYAECKCYSTDVDAPKIQEFFGKYMAKWLNNKKSQGLFIALPGVNGHAKGFYRESIENNNELSVTLYEEEKIIDLIYQSKEVVSPDVISRQITEEIGTPGDWLLLYTDKGYFLVQYVIPPGGGIANSVVLFDSKGRPIFEKETIDYLKKLNSELDDFEIRIINSQQKSTTIETPDYEEIVAVKGSSECFEYQFPAAPDFFVGRKSVFDELDSFVEKIIEKQTSARGLLFEANSGWGKSSSVLACVARLKARGHFGVAVDSRSAASSQFILRVVEYVLKELKSHSEFISHVNSDPITGFDGAVTRLVELGNELKKQNKVLFIFLDQFENIFVLPDALKRITDLLLKLSDSGTNIVLGFSWKTDLVGLTSEFPYHLRDTISTSSRVITLGTFSEIETNALLDELSKEIKAPLRKDLRFFLSEFSQGYPWLLKRLCAHVKSQVEAGVPQSNLAQSLLNVEELFQEDTRGLTVEEEATLRRIAKVAPINAMELGEELKPEVVQSLVHRRLIVRIGHKIDIYWDIFRDYLNTGKVPIRENYILRMTVGGISDATKNLVKANGTMSIQQFLDANGLQSNSYYNIMRDMKLLGLARVEDDNIVLLVSLPSDEKSYDLGFSTHLREHLKRNRLVYQILDELEKNAVLSLDEISDDLRKWCPYVSASKQTWMTYARAFADWIDASGLAEFEIGYGTMYSRTEGMQNESRHFFTKPIGDLTFPTIQYKPIENVAIRLVTASQNGKTVDWSGIPKTTRDKTLTALEHMGFIGKKNRRTRSTAIKLHPLIVDFVNNPDARPKLFAVGIQRIKSFQIFCEILQNNKGKKLDNDKLGAKLLEKLGVSWSESTTEWAVKIMLDWARSAQLAPDVYMKKKIAKSKAPSPNQLSLTSFE